jgi:transcriptional regulator NrdR family protein
MGSAALIIKRQGQRPTEAFERDKLHRSVLAACLSVRTPEGQAEATAEAVCKAVVDWLAHKSEVTSDDLRRKATEALTAFHPDAAYLYKHHQAII